MTPPDRSSRRFADTLLIFGFIVAIAAPSVDEWLRPSNVRSAQAERRRPNPRPDIQWDPLAEEPWRELAGSMHAFPEKYDAWYGDAFGLRDHLIRWHNRLKWFGLGASPTPTLVLGPKDWIFFTWHRSIDTHRGVFPLGIAELEAWRELLELRRDWLAERGIEFLFAIAPNKSAVYPEYFPARFDRVGPSRREEFFAHMNEHSDVAVLDLLPAMLAEKEHDSERTDDTTYYRLGTHWTDRGIYAGCCALLRRLAPAFPTLEPWAGSDFELRERAGGGDSWASRLYMDAQLPQLDWALAPLRHVPAREVPYPGVGDGWRRFRWEHEEADLPHLLLLHDSFGTPLLPFLAPHFGRSVGYRRKDFDAALIDVEKPDVVMMIYSERVFVSSKPHDLLESARSGLTDGGRTTNVTGSASGGAGPKRVAARFARAGETRFELDIVADAGLVEAYGDAQVVARSDVRSVSIETLNAAGGFLLPELPQEGAAGAGVLHLRLTSPRQETLRIFYMTSTAPDYDSARVLTVALDEALNDIYIDLEGLDLTGRVLVRPGRRKGRFLLHAMEVRSGDS